MAIVSDALKSFVPEHARGIKILVVDDHASSLFHLTNMLQQYSYSVTPTTSTSYALFSVHEMDQPFDLVIACYNVADMISVSFLRTMLQKDVPVIFVFSNTNDDKDVIKVLSAGAHSFLMKPIAPVHLKYVWQAASIKMLERMEKEKKLVENNGGSSPLTTTEEVGSGQGERRSNKRKRSRSDQAKRRKSGARCVNKSGRAGGDEQQLRMEMSQEIQGQSAYRSSICPHPALATTMNPGTYPLAPAVATQREGIVDRLTRVLLEQDHEELGSMLDPHLVDQYCNFFKS